MAGVLYGSVGDVPLIPHDDSPDDLPDIAALAEATGVKQTIIEPGLRITVH
jgi:hypothetical protein